MKKSLVVLTLTSIGMYGCVSQPSPEGRPTVALYQRLIGSEEQPVVTPSEGVPVPPLTRTKTLISGEYTIELRAQGPSPTKRPSLTITLADNKGWKMMYGDGVHEDLDGKIDYAEITTPFAPKNPLRLRDPATINQVYATVTGHLFTVLAAADLDENVRKTLLDLRLVEEKKAEPAKPPEAPAPDEKKDEKK